METRPLVNALFRREAEGVPPGVEANALSFPPGKYARKSETQRN
jgi:hypothetical protein